MLDTNGPQSPRLGANFVSSLQKAANRDVKQDSGCWLQRCFEVLVSATDSSETALSLPIEGGSDAGMFCVIGTPLDLTRVTYHPLGSDSGECRINPGDIILAMNEYEVSGYTRRDAMDLCIALTSRVNTEFVHSTKSPSSPLRLRLSPPQALSTGSTMLSSFLAAAFSLNSPEYALQEKIRENVYQRVVPCTTRLPRADEVDGVHYRFMSVPQFIALERSGQLLESGMYKGNHYGTPRPGPNATALDAVFLSQMSISTSSSAQLTDDSCAIPPPLPPLASLNNCSTTSMNGIALTTGSTNTTTAPTTSLMQQHPRPPRPPVRHSSIANPSSSYDFSNGMDDPDADDDPGGQEYKTGTTTSASNGSLDLGPLTTTWARSSGLNENKSYFLDCDIATSQWKPNQMYVNDPVTSTTASSAKESCTKLVNSTAWPVTSTAQSTGKPLPYGWEVIEDPKYGTFYIDHIHERTQYEPPNTEDYAMAEAAAAAANHPVDSRQTNGSQWPAEVGVQMESSTIGRSTPPQLTESLTDPSQLRGPLVSVNLVKSARGFGFTVVGGTDCHRGGFLQIKHLIPGGPAHQTNCLQVGDVLATVNSTNVLAYTHAKLVSLFQSIPVGASVMLTVSQGYRIWSDTPDSAIACSTSSLTLGGEIGAGLQIGDPPCSTSALLGMGTPRDSSFFSGSSHTSNTASPHLSLTPPSSVLGGVKGHFDGADAASGQTVVSQASATTASVSTRSRPVQRPEFLKVSIVKQTSGFGFTLADHPQGQHVKAILDPVGCGRLQVGDVVVEINDERVKEIAHTDVVQMLKQCSIGVEARLLVQRGGLYTSPLVSLLSSSSTERGFPPSVLSDEKTNSSTSSGPTEPVTSTGTRPINSHDHMPVRSNHIRTVSGGLADVGRLVDHTDSTRAQTPDPQLQRRFESAQSYQRVDFGLTTADGQMRSHQSNRRMQPSDDSVLVMSRAMPSPGSPDSSIQYGSLLRPGRMPALRPSSNGPMQGDESRGGNTTTSNPSRASFLMLPGEFLVHLQRQTTGFGFNVIGGAEEHSQVCIGSLVPNGAAQLSGVVRTGDRLVSINGSRVVGAKHRDVVQILDQAAHTVGQVTIGLQRTPELPVNGNNHRNTIPSSNNNQTSLPQDTVQVVVPRSQKGDGFGFFISNIHPRELANGARPSAKTKVECEYVAQLVPGSKAEQLGLLSVGDRILAVNRAPIAGMHHEKVVRLIRESGSHIILTIVPSMMSAWASKPSHPGGEGNTYVQFPIMLFRGSRGFGFSIRGGQEFNQMPLLVLRIADGGAAQMDGGLRVGDELMEINGYPTVGMSHGRAIEIIQAGGNIMRLVVRRDTRAIKPTDALSPMPSASQQQQRHTGYGGRVGRADQSAFCTVAPTATKHASKPPHTSARQPPPPPPECVLNWNQAQVPCPVKTGGPTSNWPGSHLIRKVLRSGEHNSSPKCEHDVRRNSASLVLDHRVVPGSNSIV